MFFFNNYKINESLGVEITSNELRLLKIQKKHEQVFIVEAESITLPKGAIQSGEVLQTEIVISSLKQLVDKTNSYGCTAGMSIPEELIFSKKIFLTNSEVLKNNKKVCGYFTEISDPIAFDYSKQANDNEWILIATKRNELKNYINILDASGLNVCIVDVDLYALIKTFSFCHNIANDASFVLLRSRADSFDVMHMNNNEIISKKILTLADINDAKKVNEKLISNDKYIMQNKSECLEGLGVNALDAFSKTFIDSKLKSSHKDFSKTFAVCLGLALRGVNL